MGVEVPTHSGVLTRKMTILANQVSPIFVSEFIYTEYGERTSGIIYINHMKLGELVIAKPTFGQSRHFASPKALLVVDDQKCFW